MKLARQLSMAQNLAIIEHDGSDIRDLGKSNKKTGAYQAETYVRVSPSQYFIFDKNSPDAEGHGGDGKSNAVEAIRAAKRADFELADEKIKAAEESLLQAHHAQTEMLSEEAEGHHRDVTLLMVHGQDHLMTAIAFKDLAKEIVELYKVILQK